MQRTNAKRLRTPRVGRSEQAARRRFLPALRLGDGVRAIQRVVTRNPGCQGPWVVSVVLFVTAASGCRMCPDPFDYSGPVPNGSAPQNDFRARSTGTRPLNAAPRPWPPVVQSDQDPTPSAPGDGQTPPSVLVASATDTGEDQIVPVVREAIEQAATSVMPATAFVEPTPLEPVPESCDLPTPRNTPQSEPAVDAGSATGATAPVVPTVPASAEAGTQTPAPSAPVPAGRLTTPRELPFAETPGWRPRR